MYLRAAKTDAEAAGESTEGMANSISELREEILALTGGAVDIQIDENTYKSTFEILQELSKVYDKLTDVSQANLLELLGGKRNSNVVAALLENFSVAEEALATSADSAGSAMAENEKYLDSINGKISIFKATFEELSTKFIDSTFVKDIVDAGTNLLKVLTVVGTVVEKIGGLGNILKVLVPVVGLLNAGQITDLVSSLKVVKGITSTLKAIPQAANGAHNYLLKFLNLFWSGNGILSSFGVTLKSLWTNMSLFSKLTWITIAITAVIKIIDTFVVTTEEANEKLKESKIEYQESTDKLESLNKELQTTNERISELQSKGKLSFTEQEELNRLQQLNQELRTNIDLEQTKLDIASKQRSNDLIDFYKSYTQTRSNLGLDSFGNLTLISDAEKLRSLYAEYTAQMASGFLEQANQTSTKISNIVSEIINAIDEISYIENPQTELDEKHNAVLDSLNKVILSYNIFSGQEGAKGKALDFLTSNPYKEATQSLTELGKAGQVTATTLQNDSYDDFIDTAISMKIITDDSAESLAFLASYFNDVGDTAEDSANKISNLSTETQSYISTLEGIQSLSAGLDQLDKIYADIYNKEDFDWGSIFNNKEFTETFIGFTEEYEEFIKTVSNSPNDIKACQAAFNNLTTAYLSTCKELQNVTAETRNATIAFLEQKGVANAAAIVDAQLALNKEKVRLESQGVTAASTTEAVAILEAAEASETERVALAQLLIEKIRVNQITIDTSGDIANLIALAEQAGATTGSIANLIKAKELLALAEGIEADGALGLSGDADINQALIGSLRAQADELKNAPITYNPSKNATYTGGSATNSAKEAASKQAKQEKTWFDKQLAEHKHLVAMEKETQEEYLNWLDSAYKKAYKEGKIDLEEYYKYEEEVFNGRKDLFKDHLNDTEHKISVLSNTSGNEEEIKNLYKDLIWDIEKELADARARGLDETDDYYQELMNKQQGYYDEMESLFEDHLNDTEHKISILEEFDSQDEEVIKLTKGLIKDVEAELADAYARGLDENDEYVQGLLDQYQDYYDQLFDMFEDHLNDIDHEISMRENYDGETQNIIKLHEQAKLDIEKELADLRAQGYTDNDEKVQKLQSEWVGHDNAIRELQEEAAKDAKDAFNELVDWKVKILKQEIQDEKDALNERLDNLREFYDEQREMLQDQYDEEKYLEEQAEKRRSVSDIQAELAMLQNDDSAWAQKRKLELQEELTGAQKELDDFEKDHSLDLAMDAIDKAEEEQTKRIEAQMEALDKKLNDPAALYNRALMEIVAGTGNIYREMLDYNNKHGSGNKQDIHDQYEDIYKSLDTYEDIFGKPYRGAEIENSTNYQPNKGSWDESVISGTNPDNQVQAEPNLPPSTPTPKPEITPSPSTDTSSIYQGSVVQVKPTTTNFSAKSGNAEMKPHIPGGTYVVMDMEGAELLLGINGTPVGWVYGSDIIVLDSIGISGYTPSDSTTSSNSPSGSSNSSAPSLSKGATVTIKTSATHFGSKSNGVKMASWVPGSNFTVMGTSGDQVQIGRDGAVTGWVKKSDIVGYASGSNYTKAGLAQIFEEGYEQIFTSVDGNKYKLFNAGDKVLNAKATEFLYDFAESGGAIINNILAKLLYGNMPKLIGDNAKLMDIHLGDIIIQGNADNKTVSEIRRAQRDNIDYILTEFSKLNR